jgi:hypothetical protein
MIQQEQELENNQQEEVTQTEAPSASETPSQSLSVRDEIEKAYKQHEKIVGEDDGEAGAIEGGQEKQEDNTSDLRKSKEKEQQADENEDISPPAYWTKEGKDQFSKLPKEAQKIILFNEKKANGFISRKVNELQNVAKRYSEIDAAIAPYEKSWNLNGITAGQVMRQFLSMQELLDTDLRQGLERIARSYGKSLDEVLTQRTVYNPEMEAYQNRINELENMFYRQEQEKAVNHHNTLVNELKIYSDETDSSGQKIRPYFEDVAYDIIPIFEALKRYMPDASPRELLDEAYKRAEAISPIVQQKKQRQQQNISRSRLESAKTAGSSISGAPNGGGGGASSARNNQSETVRDTILQAFNDLS